MGRRNSILYRRTEKNGMDFAFVIDASGSMSYDHTPQNDRNGLRLTLSKKMVEKMADKDRAMVVKFATTATLLQALTSEKDLISKAIDKVDSYGMTAMKDGIHIANMDMYYGLIKREIRL